MKNQAYPPKSPRNSAIKPQSGNVLILILIAVALFGSLSWVMMRGNRASTGMMTGEQAKLQAQEMIGYANTVQQGIKEMLIGGLSIEQISFVTFTLVNQNGTPFTSNSATCSIDTCRLFKPSGGGVKEITFYDNAVPLPSWLPTYIHAGGFDFMMADIKDVGTTYNDIVMRIHGVAKEVCDAINTTMGLPLGTVSESVGIGTFYDTYDIADYKDNADSVKFGYTITAIAGKRTFCDTGSRTLYMVVHAL